MYSYANFKDKLRRYAAPTQKEVIWMVIMAIVFGFMFSFNSWGTTTFDISMGLQSFMISSVLVALMLFVHEAAQRVSALTEGYQASFKPWIPGVVVGLLIVFLTNGRFLFLAPGMVMVKFLEVHRLGKSFYDLNYKHIGWIAMAGPIAMILFAVILRAVSPLFGYPDLITQAIRIAVWLAIFNMVPAPNFNGIQTFFGSRYIYVFVTAAIICCSLLLFYTGVWLSIIGSLIVGGLLLLAFFLFVDQSLSL